MRPNRSATLAPEPPGSGCPTCDPHGRPGYVPAPSTFGQGVTAWKRCPAHCGPANRAQAAARHAARAAWRPAPRAAVVPAPQESAVRPAPAPRSAPAQSRRPAAASARRRQAPAERAPELVAAVLLEVEGSAVVADVPGIGVPGAKTLEALFAWIASGPALGVAPLHRDGRRHNGTVVLGPDLCRALKLPAKLPDPSKRAALADRLTAAADAAGCDLGKAIGTRIAVKPRRAAGVRRAPSVTLVVTPWLGQGKGPEEAVNYWLDRLGDGDAATLAARLRDVAFDLGVPLTGTARVTARTLLEAVRPREEWGPNRDGTRVLKAGAMVDGDTCVPPAAGRFHPLTDAALEAGDALCREDDFIRWTRPLTAEESALPLGVELDVCTAHLAVTGSLYVPVGPLRHQERPAFDKKTAGLWWCDFTGLTLCAPSLTADQAARAEQLLPHAATPSGHAPDGPGWYATPTVAYMVEAYGFDPATIAEGYVSDHSVVQLKEWTTRLRDAYKFRLAVLGIGDGMEPADFMAAYEGRQEAAQRDRQSADALVLSELYKEVYRANTGSWSENPRGDSAQELERWTRDVVASWHYRPEIRFAILAASRTAMHRRLVNTYARTGRAPFAVHVDGVVYASETDDPAALVPLDDAGKQLPGAIRLGAAPGSCKHDATVPMAVVSAALEAGEPLQGSHGVVPQYGTDGQLIEQQEGAHRG